MHLVIVAAVADNNVIGNKGKLPWHLHSDLRHFRALTLDKPVIMGRKTFQSIGKPLDRRTNIVVSRDKKFAPAGVTVAPSFKAALDIAKSDAKRRGTEEIAVIGGSAIFADAMPLADRLEITHVHAKPDGDVHFPPIDLKHWREEKREVRDAGPNDDAGFAIATYVRR